jgi:hypothetical protein
VPAVLVVAALLLVVLPPPAPVVLLDASTAPVPAVSSMQAEAIAPSAPRTPATRASSPKMRRFIIAKFRARSGSTARAVRSPASFA